MKIKNTFVLSIVTLILLALPATALAAPSTNSAFLSTSAQAGGNSDYTGLAISTTSTSTSTSTDPSLSDSAQTGAQKLLRDKVFLNLDKSYLIVSKDLPVKVEAVVSGWLPDPCHILQVATKASIVDNIISIQVYSLYDPTQACISVLQPFSTTVPLGIFGKGEYTVLVNGENLGSFGSSISSSITASIPTINSVATSKATVNFIAIR